MNLKRIAENLEKFKRSKSERTNNPKWKAKRVYLSELQPSVDEWPDVYEVIVSEALLCEHGMDNTENGSSGTNAFSIADSSNPMKEAFQVCLLYTSPSPRDQRGSRMPSSA